MGLLTSLRSVVPQRTKSNFRLLVLIGCVNIVVGTLSLYFGLILLEEHRYGWMTLFILFTLAHYYWGVVNIGVKIE